MGRFRKLTSRKNDQRQWVEAYQLDDVSLTRFFVPLRLKPLIRSELINRLAALFPQLTTQDTELAVKTILEALSNTLVKGGRIEIRGFGSFRLNHRPPRIGRNPKTGEAVLVPAKAAPHFQVGKELRTKVDSGR